MPTPSFRLLVILFWTAMMGWLFQRELLPRLVLGPPPNYQGVVSALDPDDGRPVRWSVRVGVESIGWAETQTTRRGDGTVVLSSTAHLTRVPIPWGVQESLDRPLQADTHFYVSETGKLRHFDITARVGESGEPLLVRGRVEAGQLHVVLQAGTTPYETTLPYDSRGLVMDAFSPVGRLPNLRLGQTWNVPVINPLTGGVDLVRAKVSGRELIPWGDHPVAALVVTQPGPAGSEARTWVRADGTVLRQQVPLLFSTMTFDREPDSGAREP